MKSYKEFMTEAEKRIKMVRLHHGTSPESADKIKKSGFTGGEHGEVHTSTNPKTARAFGARYSKKPRNVTMLVPAKSIKNKKRRDQKQLRLMDKDTLMTLGGDITLLLWILSMPLKE